MSLSQAEERELIERARRGDDQAFGQLVTHHTPQLFRVIRRVVDDTGEAESAVQEAFLRVWQALPRYQSDRPFFPYLATVAMNLVRDRWRQERRLDFAGLEDVGESLPAPSPGPETLAEEAETLQALAQAVAGLPEGYRTVIALRYDGGLTYQQIAEALELPLNTVRTHLRRAKELLQEELRRRFEEGDHG